MTNEVKIFRDLQDDTLEVECLDSGEFWFKNTLTESGEGADVIFSTRTTRELRDFLTAKLEGDDGDNE